MKKALPLLVLIGACAPDIAQDDPPPSAIVVQFDPSHTETIDGKAYPAPIVPLPNDLAKNPETGLLVVTSLPTDTDAQKEFNEKYLSKLNGFPFESTAQVRLSGNLKPETVTPQTVVAIDVTNPAAPADVPITPQFVPANPDAKQDARIVIPPPQGGWTRAHRYAVALAGGPNGLRGAENQDVIGSSTWALVSAPNELVTCTDLNNFQTCKLNVDIIPSEEHDPQLRFDDLRKKGLQLEKIRRGYAPLIAALKAKGLATVATLWTFSIVDAGEMTFDPANRVIPFPNDVLRDRTTSKVNLPNPKTGAALAPADCQGATDATIQLYCGLNTLDGFSTTTAPISENSSTAGAAQQATIAASSLSTASVGLLPLLSKARKEIQTKPQYTPCLNCLSSKDANGNAQTSPQQLQLSLDAPLDEQTTYAAFIKTEVKDDQGKGVVANPIFALVRSSAPLVVDGKSAVSILSDAQAAQLEPLREGYKPMFDVLDTLGHRREDLALAWGFTTLTVSGILEQLHGAPLAASTLPDYPVAFQSADALKGVAAALVGNPLTNVAKVYAGAVVTPVLLTGPGGTINTAGPVIQPMQFTITVPAGTAPVGGWPIVVYNHGFGNWRNDFFYVANELAAKGLMVISADAVFHGERASCTGAKAANSAFPSDDAVCADFNTMKCDGGTPQGLCVLRSDAARNACNVGPLGDAACATAGQGRCAADSKCQGAGAGLARRPNTGAAPAFSNTLVSGWNALNPVNFFATRDNMRQVVVDLSQLVRVMKSSTTASPNLAQVLGADTYNKEKIHFIGHSLGGISGSLFTSVSPDTHNVAINASGGAWTRLLLNSETYASLRDRLFDTLQAQGINRGTPEFDQFIGTAQWIMDQADPVNVAFRNRTPTAVQTGAPTAPPADRKLFVSFIEGDASVSNIGTLAFIRAANRTFNPVPPSYGCVDPLLCYHFTEKGDTFDAATATVDTRHRFLLEAPTGSAGGAIKAKAQTQVSTFLSTGALP